MELPLQLDRRQLAAVAKFDPVRQRRVMGHGMECQDRMPWDKVGVNLNDDDDWK